MTAPRAMPPAPNSTPATLWQGIVYAVDGRGRDRVDAGAPATSRPERLLFPGLPWQLSFTETFAAAEPADLPFEVFERTGCAG